jgi:hypothetical protein
MGGVGEEPWRKWLLPGIAIAVVVALVGVALASGGDDKESGTTAGGASEVFLEPIASVGRDPFTESVAAPPPPPPTIPANTPITIQPAGPQGAAITAPTFPPSGGAAGGTTLPTGGPEGGAASPGIRTVSGGTPGLYGGTRDQRSCNAEQMVQFLTANPSKGREWARVQGITFEELPTFIRGLTPVLLRSDTRVTNHGFSRGRATPRQYVLQAGTAVLVDEKGEPRARCACGNPLLTPVPVAEPQYTGPAWPGFSPTNITVIQQSTTNINIITVINIKTGEPYGQPPGTAPPVPVPPNTAVPTTTTTQPPTTGTGLTIPPNINAGTGDVQVTLLWTGGADLDLHVRDPANAELSYQQKTSPSGGKLDVDQNATCPGQGDNATHVENVFWPTGGAPAGNYAAWVINYKTCGSTNFTFQLTIKVGGNVVYNQTQSVGAAPGSKSQEVPFTRS